MLGLGYLLAMGVANICFLLGPFGEAMLKPDDPQRYRRTAWRMGLWGSVALPFAWPLLYLSALISPTI